ncbi:MAG: invasin domain 3-containing protein [Cocleimonas sp.]
MFNSKLLSLVFFFLLSFTQAAKAETVTILPLGDSITDGNGFNNPNSSYRDELYTLLNNEGFDTAFVGTQSNFFGNVRLYHEGHPGKRADFIDNNINAWYDGYLASFNINQVDIVLLHAGTNDILHHLDGSFPTTDTQTRIDIEGIISKLQAKNPDITVLVAKLIPLEATVTDKATGLNTLLTTTWANSKSVGNSSVIIVDQNSGFITPNDYADTDIHPNQSGENKMASKWFDTLIQQQIIQQSKTLPVTTDLTLWLDASDVNADGIEDTSTSVVNTWTDKSGKSNDVTKRPGSAAGLQLLAGLNGKPIVDFNSSSLETPDADQITADSGYTKFVVFKTDDASAENNLISSDETALWGGSGSEPAGSIHTWHSNNFLSSSANVVTTNTYHIASTRYGQGESIPLVNILRLDGILLDTNNVVKPHSDSKTNIGSIGDGNYLDGKIAEALIYDRALSDAEITLVENYLSDKWGLLSDVNASNSTVTATPTTIDADGTTTSILTITVKDDGNLPLSGLSVIISQGAGSSNIGSVTDNNDGTYTASITSLVAETVTYSIKADNVLITQTANITFETIASLVDANTSTVTSAPTTVVADGSDTSTITVTVNDASSNPLLGLTVSIDQGSGNSTIGAVTDNTDGTYSFDVISTTLETVTYTATADGISITDTAEVEFTIGDADPTTSIISATPITQVADGSSFSTITIQLKDASGNNLTSDTDTVVFSTTGSAQLTALVNNNNGTYSTTVKNSVAEQVTITATLNLVNVTDDTSVTFTVGAASTATSTLTSSPTTVTANGVTSSTITLQAIDATGNHLTTGGNSVLFTSTGNAIVTSTFDNSNGSYTATVTNQTAEQVTISATLDTNTVVDTSNITFVPGAASTATSTVTATPTSVTANGTTTSTITLHAIDATANNLIIGGDTVVFTSTGNASLNTVLDNDDGTYTATITNTSVEQVTVSATLNGVAVTDTANVTFTVGLPDASHSNVVASPTSVTANGTSASIVTVTLKDANNNPVPGLTTLTLQQSPTALSNIGVVSDLGNGNYSFSVTSTTAGTVTYTAIANGTMITQTAIVEFTVGAPSALTSTITATPENIEANGNTESTITLQVKDANNNPVLNLTNVTLSSSPSTVSIGSVNEIDGGNYTFTVTSTVAEVYTFTAIADGVTLNDVLNIEFVEPVNAASNIIPILQILLLEDE